MTIEQLTPAVLFSALLSLLVEWVPGLGAWWEALTANKKRGIMAFGIALITIGTMLFNCQSRQVCPADAWIAVRDALLIALLSAAANQSVHLLTKKTTPAV